MAEQTNKPQEQAGAQPAAQQQQQQGRPCPRDCTRCGFQQHAYCAASMCFQMFDVMNGVIRRLDAQSQHIAKLEQRLASIQSSEAGFSSPMPIGDSLQTEQTE